MLLFARLVAGLAASRLDRASPTSGPGCSGNCREYLSIQSRPGLLGFAGRSMYPHWRSIYISVDENPRVFAPPPSPMGDHEEEVPADYKCIGG